ncbi:hypothetical protein BHM03_00036102 [Ensete ventricosum]|nr:hypothetical protein BHM03_00036102 [Ensete ventricosum]
MQGLVHGRQSVRAHPKARSELDAMEHQNFLFGMERIRVTQEWVDEGELPRERTKNRRWRRTYEVLAEATHGEVVVRVNRISASPATRWRRPRMRVAVCLFIDQGELLGGHSGVEAGGRKGRGSDDESSGAQLPKSKASVRKEVDSEEHHSAAEADLPIVKEGIRMQGNG